MKVTCEVDCTPEEARRFLGLPDVGRINDAYIDALSKMMKGRVSVEQLQELAKQVSPMGQYGMKMFQKVFEGGVAMTTMGTKFAGRKTDS